MRIPLFSINDTLVPSTQVVVHSSSSTITMFPEDFTPLPSVIITRDVPILEAVLASTQTHIPESVSGHCLTCALYNNDQRRCSSKILFVARMEPAVHPSSVASTHSKRSCLQISSFSRNDTVLQLFSSSHHSPLPSWVPCAIAVCCFSTQVCLILIVAYSV